MNIYKCPVCNNPLNINEKTYKCKLNHSYDIAKKRYVNLMLANQGHSLQEGDNKMMIQARSDFLNSKKYDVLLNSIISNVSSLPLTKIIFCDVACGDGYYTTKIQEEISKNKEIKTIGIDISKDAIQQASTRRNILKINNLEYVIGNMDYLPFMNDSFNVLLNSFAPINEKEFQRVLKSNGYYQNDNTGNMASYAICKISFTITENTSKSLNFLCNQTNDHSYDDYALFSNIDTTLTKSSSIDTSKVYTEFVFNTKGIDMRIHYDDISVGEHFIYVKFARPRNNNVAEYFNFKVRE